MSRFGLLCGAAPLIAALAFVGALVGYAPAASAQAAATPGDIGERLRAGEVVLEDVTNGEGMAGLKASFEVKAPRHAIWNILTDYGHYREVFKNVEDLSVEEENEHGARVRFRIKASWFSFGYTLERDYEEPDRRLTWHRVAGDFNRLVGAWTIGDGSDADHSLVTCESYVDIGFHVPTTLVRQWARTEMRNSMLRIRSQAEQASH